MKYAVSILLLSLGLSSQLQAQETYNSSGARMASKAKKKQEPKGFDKDKLIYGAGLRFNFANGGFRAGISPVIGYRITDRFGAGVSLGYQYDSQRDVYRFNTGSGYQTKPLRRHMIIPSVWARFIAFNNIFVQAEAEYNFQNWRGYVQDSDPNSPTYGEPVKQQLNITSPAVLIGPGYRQPIGEYSSMYVMVMYDVIQNPNSPYYGFLDYRIGFNFGW